MSWLDAHQHFWWIRRRDYGWLTPAQGPLWRDFGPDDLRPLLRAHGVTGTVLVQAAPSERETRLLLRVAARRPWIRGVVGWVDLAAADAADRLARLAAHPKFVGLRPMLQDLPDPAWVLQPQVVASLRRAAALGLAFDALVRAPQLPVLGRLLAAVPGLRVVIDHAGKPPIAAGAFQPWADQLAALAAHPGVYCKLSGLLGEAPPGADAATLRPWVAHLLECFGPERLIWGSDWPVLTAVADYGRWRGLCETLLRGLPAAARRRIGRDNAVEFYRVSA
ncbi:MAG: hydrolase [Gammaproteobacteria bacterium]|nr:MAG: hydrolase [Gammaproteobacteria bacterium]